MEITIDAKGIEQAAKQLDPRRAYEALMKWYATATVYVRDEMRSQAPKSLKGKIIIKVDTLRPPHWARIRPKSRLAHLIEGGTGRLGSPEFHHVARHWPSTEGIMRQTGLPKAEAFVMARTIGLRGGNPPRPFIKPTYLAVKGHVEQLAVQAVNEVWR